MSRTEAEEDDDATKALRAASRLAREGKYAEALERHVWYHQNALRINEAGNYGLRLGTALGLWKELADKYPPALASLKATRDAGREKVEAGTGSPDIFHEVISITEKLGEEPATVALFKTLAAKHAALAKRWFLFVQQTLINQGEIELFSEHGGELVQYLIDYEIRLHEELVKVIKSGTAFPGPGDLIKESEEDLVQATLKLFAVATKRGDTATATRLKALAFKVVPDPRIQP